MEFTRKMFLWQQTFATLFSVSNKLLAKGNIALESLTSRQLFAMIAIAHLPEGNASLNRIAQKLGTSKQNVKQLILALEKKGFVRVIPSRTNKSAYNVEILEEKKNDFNECFMQGMNFLSEIFKDFSENELEAFWSMLQKLYCYDGEVQDGFEEDMHLWKNPQDSN